MGRATQVPTTGRFEVEMEMAEKPVWVSDGMGDREQKVKATQGARRACGAHEARGGSQLRQEGVAKTQW